MQKLPIIELTHVSPCAEELRHIRNIAKVAQPALLRNHFRLMQVPIYKDNLLAN